jgi:hypothetical protein
MLVVRPHSWSQWLWGFPSENSQQLSTRACTPCYDYLRHCIASAPGNPTWKKKHGERFCNPTMWHLETTTWKSHTSWPNSHTSLASLCK